MNRATLWIVPLLVCSLVGCAGGGSNSAPDIKVSSEITPQPPQKGPATVRLSLTGPDRKAVAGASLRVEGNMSHAGMKPVFADASEVKPGVYEAQLDFTMSGDWFLLIEGTLSDGRRLTRKIDVPGVGGGAKHGHHHSAP